MRKKMLILLTYLCLCGILTNCNNTDSPSSHDSEDTNGDFGSDWGSDSNNNFENDSEKDSGTQADTGQKVTPLRIEAECAWGPDLGDCNGAVEGGFNSDLPERDGASSIPLLKEGQKVVGYFYAGSWLAFPGINLLGYNQVALQVAAAKAGAFEVRIGAPDGELLATIVVPDTGGWDVFTRVEAQLLPVSGVHTVYLVSADNDSYNGDVDWIEFFAGDSAPDPDTGSLDTGSPDTGSPDTGSPDTGSPDTGSGKMFVGNITTYGSVRSDFVQYWDQITPENEGKWSSVEGTRGQYNWRALDAVYAYSRDNNIAFKQHTFVWGNQSPGWINNLSSTEQAQAIENWIREYCNRYPDTEMIDVVNESTPGHAPAEYARSAFGANWIIRSFELARQYCPNSILILNDYNVLSWNTDGFINMARPAVEAGVVDALGCQAHGLEDWSLSDIERKLNQVAALGLPVYISEYDVNIADDQRQLNVMREQFTMFYNHPSVVGITLWGYVLGRTWIPNSGIIHDDGRFRPAMTWLMDYLDR